MAILRFQHSYILLFLLLLCVSSSFAQTQAIDSIPKNGVVLNKGWKFAAGDNSEWAKPEFNDSPGRI